MLTFRKYHKKRGTNGNLIKNSLSHLHPPKKRLSFSPFSPQGSTHWVVSLLDMSNRLDPRIVKIRMFFLPFKIYNFCESERSCSSKFWFKCCCTKESQTRPRVNCAGVCNPQATTVYVGTGWYLVVPGQYGVVLVGTWRYWVSGRRHWLIYDDTGSV